MSGWQRARRVAGFDSFFVWYTRRLVRGNFARVWVAGVESLPAHGGYVAVANHHSWWDGLIPYLLHHERERERPFAVMMSDAELRRFPFFRFGGAFSVDARSVRAARDAVRYAADEARAGAAVWIFPDGVLHAPSAPLAFTSGFEHVAREAGVPIVPAAMRFVFRDRQRPEIFVRYGEPIVALRGARERTQACVAAMLAEIDRLLADGQIEQRFRIAVSGRAGVDDRVALAPR
ncbi:MAG: lysophospholipid acyltransferase family protein [bacterium]|nr:lysophospholipid acyltransferase family protein [bacterium]